MEVIWLGQVYADHPPSTSLQGLKITDGLSPYQSAKTDAFGGDFDIFNRVSGDLDEHAIIRTTFM